MTRTDFGLLFVKLASQWHSDQEPEPAGRPATDAGGECHLVGWQSPRSTGLVYLTAAHRSPEARNAAAGLKQPSHPDLRSTSEQSVAQNLLALGFGGGRSHRGSGRNSPRRADCTSELDFRQSNRSCATEDAMNKPIRVLLIDDQELFRVGLRVALRPYDDICIAGEAEDGPSGLALVADRKPDVAIVDIRLPGMDGIEVAEQIQQISPDTRIMLISGYLDDEAIKRGHDLGVRGIIAKTDSPRQIAGFIRGVDEGLLDLGPAESDPRAETEKTYHRSGTSRSTRLSRSKRQSLEDQMIQDILASHCHLNSDEFAIRCAVTMIGNVLTRTEKREPLRFGPDERRTSPRVVVQVPVAVTPAIVDHLGVWIPQGINAAMPARSRDISLRGVGLAHAAPLVNHQALVTFSPPAAEPICLVIEAVWSQSQADGSHVSGSTILGVIDASEFNCRHLEHNLPVGPPSKS